MKSRDERRVLLHVRALFSGSAAADIPRGLLPDVDSHLTQLLARSGPAEVGRVQSLLKAVKNVELRFGLIEAKARPAPRDSTPAAALDVALGKLCAGSPVRSLDPAVLPDLIPFVRERIGERRADGDLSTAQLYEDALQQLNCGCYSALRLCDHIARRDELLGGIERLDRALRELEAQVQRDLMSHNLRVQKELEEERRRWADAVTAFDDETRRGVPRRFRKFSAEVMEMKAVETALIRGRRFQEALIVRRQRSARQRVERRVWGARFVESRAKAKRKLKRGEELRVDWIESSNALLRQRIEAEGRRCIEVIQKAKANLANKVADFDRAIAHGSTF
jgi:hypothetical protein